MPLYDTLLFLIEAVEYGFVYIIICFKYVQSAFVISEDRRDYVYGVAGYRLRTFRSYLTREYLKDKNKEWKQDPPMEPPPQYFIHADVWKEFVQQRFNENFKVLFINVFNKMYKYDIH